MPTDDSSAQLARFHAPLVLSETTRFRINRLHEEAKRFADFLHDTLPNVDTREKVLEELFNIRSLAEGAIQYGRSPLNLRVLAELFHSVEVHDVRVARLWLNPTEFADLRKVGFKVFEPTTQRENLRRGLMGVIWTNCEVWVSSKKIPAGHVVLVPDLLGKENPPNPLRYGEHLFHYPANGEDLAPDWTPSKSQLKEL